MTQARDTRGEQAKKHGLTRTEETMIWEALLLPDVRTSTHIAEIVGIPWEAVLDVTHRDRPDVDLEHITKTYIDKNYKRRPSKKARFRKRRFCEHCKRG